MPLWLGKLQPFGIDSGGRNRIDSAKKDAGVKQEFA